MSLQHAARIVGPSAAALPIGDPRGWARIGAQTPARRAPPHPPGVGDAGPHGPWHVAGRLNAAGIRARSIQ
jgi:hypothetical protein